MSAKKIIRGLKQAVRVAGSVSIITMSGSCRPSAETTT
jgi:hypothetical protein